jgi:hypothetical protein
MSESPSDFPTSTGWPGANQRCLVAALALVRARLLTHSGAAVEKIPDEATLERALASAEKNLTATSSLQHVCTNFRLSTFERDVLLLCAGCELDASFAKLCASAQGDERRVHPTFGLALAALANPHWSALNPGAPLRNCHLIEVGPGEHLTSSPLRIDERVLHFLTGVASPDPRLRGLLESVGAPDQLTPSHRERARELAALWRRAQLHGGYPTVQLLGADRPSAAAVAAAAAAEVDLQVQILRAADLPTQAAEREILARLLERDATLEGFALLIEVEAGASPEVQQAAVALVELMQGPLLLGGAEPLQLRARPVARLQIPPPVAAEQRQLWRDTLGAAACAALNGQVDLVSAQFQLSPAAIRAAGKELVRDHREGADLGLQLWDACRAQTRPKLDNLARRIDSLAQWDDLVLPIGQRQTLRTIVAHVRQRTRVYEQWGFAARSERGLGIGALFSGSSGTGKTMAAEVLANELRLDLYRIDLSALVSKYIGETEKNLRQVFDAAEAGGAILLFDEADALFGKRSEVRDSHDRYANIEVSYLLQRIESYRGLVILTTNQPQALDTAFARRIRFAVQFPFPDAKQRTEIWRKVFPAATPTEGLKLEKLARLTLTGGHIRNLALNAAFLAADVHEPVRM